MKQNSVLCKAELSITGISGRVAMVLKAIPLRSRFECRWQKEAESWVVLSNYLYMQHQ